MVGSRERLKISKGKKSKAVTISSIYKWPEWEGKTKTTVNGGERTFSTTDQYHHCHSQLTLYQGPNLCMAPTVWALRASEKTYTAAIWPQNTLWTSALGEEPM